MSLFATLPYRIKDYFLNYICIFLYFPLKGFNKKKFMQILNPSETYTNSLGGQYV